jgi:hypothetical protein
MNFDQEILHRDSTICARRAREYSRDKDVPSLLPKSFHGILAMMAQSLRRGPVLIVFMAMASSIGFGLLGCQSNVEPDVNVSQRAVLYEEDPAARGEQYAGTVTWRTETASPQPGQPPDLAVRATIQIPDRHVNVAWSLRRNMDKTLSASHIVEIAFTLPANFTHGGISSIPGLLMKEDAQARGMPLASQSVKMTNVLFVVRLSADESRLQRNVQLLKELGWLDIPIVYNDNRRAILAVEKGASGQRVFADAFAFWAR